MAKKTRYYRCSNKYGDNPCPLAEKNEMIPEDKAIPAIDGKLKCPGKFPDGSTCNKELIHIGPPIPPKPPWRELLIKWAPIGGGVIVGLVLIGVLICYFSCGGEPKLAATPSSLLFPYVQGGTATAEVRISNKGDGKLVINAIETQPAAFSVKESKMSIAPNEDAKLPVRFESSSRAKVEGQLILHSNDPNLKTMTINLIANRDPWWVYDTLETSSTILQRKQGQGQ